MKPSADIATQATERNTDYPYHCPAGEQHCDWLHELAGLKREIQELNRLVSRDPLTGLFNLRHFSELLPAQLEGAQRNQRHQRRT